MRTKTLCLDNRNVHYGPQVLVNAQAPVVLPVDEAQLVAPDDRYPDVKMEMRAASMYTQLINSLELWQHIVPVSAYRCRRQQADIYEESARVNGTDFTSAYVAPPGCSEHQTGLAVDVALKRKNIDFIRPDFPDRGAGHLFRQKAARYGFIERYPKDKHHITGIAHEPWHFRYVGFPHSKIIEQKGLTLEEYAAFLRDFPYRERHMAFDHNGTKVEIAYARRDPGPCTTLQVPAGVPYQISGDNCSGFILTLWRMQA
ncbi:MAG: D-alanyl-D-alanine carboxypeptidase family protein [Christensenellales bacterium]|jgi:D-alanyl-D-alanine dipeptidase/carboxypeptidase